MPRRDPTEMPHADQLSDGLSGFAQVENVLGARRQRVRRDVAICRPTVGGRAGSSPHDSLMRAAAKATL